MTEELGKESGSEIISDEINRASTCSRQICCDGFRW